MTETIQQLKENIALLQMKLQKLEELQRTKSPAEEAFRKVYYRYPDKLDDKYGSAWDIFEKGYNASKATEVEPSMTNCVLLGNPPDGYVAWNEWYNEMGSKGILHNLKISDISAKEYQQEPEKEQQIKELVREGVKWCEEHPNESVEDYLTPQERGDRIHKEVENEIEKLQEKNWYVDAKDLIKEWGEKNKPPTLYEILMDWWINHLDMMEQSDERIIDDLVNIIGEKFIPPSNDTNGYEWEKCLKMMRGKLR